MELVVQQHEKEYQINEKRRSSGMEGSMYDQNLKEKY
jgi:hypothetical protein